MRRLFRGRRRPRALRTGGRGFLRRGNPSSRRRKNHFGSPGKLAQAEACATNSMACRHQWHGLLVCARVFQRPARQTPEITQSLAILRGFPVAFPGLRLARLSDIRHGLYISLPVVEPLVEATNHPAPDLMALTARFDDFFPGLRRPGGARSRKTARPIGSLCSPGQA